MRNHLIGAFKKTRNCLAFALGRPANCDNALNVKLTPTALFLTPTTNLIGSGTVNAKNVNIGIKVRLGIFNRVRRLISQTTRRQ